jgi:phenylacetyl-CoA:acceptor oxidoreductase subunit 1
MSRWGMVIDLRKCIGCSTCKEVCDQSDERPPGVSRIVIEKERDNDAQGERFFMTMSCMHCEHPPCQDTCPTKATYRRPDGIIEIRENLCIGCGTCIVACPYRARSICTEDVICRKELSDREENEKSDVDRIGICTKCNFCSQIIDAGLQKGLKPGEDSEATPLCVRFCIAGALYFGDLDDKKSTVSKLIQENKTTRLLEEMGTAPNIYYILK